jgi:hypothetical protein
MSGGRSGLVVFYDSSVMNANKTMNKRMDALYNSVKGSASQGGAIITVGDGDFSFSLSLTADMQLRSSTGSSRLIATSYDPLSQLVAKYPAAPLTITQLAKQGVCVLHSVDATDLLPSLQASLRAAHAQRRPTFVEPHVSDFTHCASRIIFNFPHLGGSTLEDVEMNRSVLRGYFRSAHALLRPPTAYTPRGSPAAAAAAVAALPPLPLATTKDVTAVRAGVPPPVITAASAGAASAGGAGAAVEVDALYGGQVHVALRTSVFYQSWQIVELAQENGLRLLKTAPFKSLHYPGYQEQRTVPGNMRTLPPIAEGALIYVFVRDPELWLRREPPVTAPAAGAAAGEARRAGMKRAQSTTGAGAGDGDDEEEEEEEEEEEGEKKEAPKRQQQQQRAAPASASLASAAVAAAAVAAESSLPAHLFAMLARLRTLPPKSKDARNTAAAVKAAAAKVSPAATATVVSSLKALGVGGGSGAAAAAAPAAPATPAPAPAGTGPGSGPTKRARPADSVHTAGASAAAPARAALVVAPSHLPLALGEDEDALKSKGPARVRGAVATVDVGAAVQESWEYEQQQARARLDAKAAKKAANRAARAHAGPVAAESDLFSVRGHK